MIRYQISLVNAHDVNKIHQQELRAMFLTKICLCVEEHHISVKHDQVTEGKKKEGGRSRRGKEEEEEEEEEEEKEKEEEEEEEEGEEEEEEIEEQEQQQEKE
ncbi:hypothetical protein ElyMa_002920800 [Elysia marginata]|uniref:Uncharacterized protein n=1 Tax=Elysia marginata TaxID=1093978 RepID=A0AAV4I6T0_9GAST|nr:hypothetical protein ElyMa_002920800 [Elysia marginata]